MPPSRKFAKISRTYDDDCRPLVVDHHRKAPPAPAKRRRSTKVQGPPVDCDPGAATAKRRRSKKVHVPPLTAKPGALRALKTNVAQVFTAFEGRPAIVTPEKSIRACQLQSVRPSKAYRPFLRKIYFPIPYLFEGWGNILKAAQDEILS